MTAAAEDELAKHKLRDEYIMHYKKEYDYYVEHYKQELEKMAPGETIPDLKPYHYETPPAPVITDAPKSDGEDAPAPPAEEAAPPPPEPAEEQPVEEAAPEEPPAPAEQEPPVVTE